MKNLVCLAVWLSFQILAVFPASAQDPALRAALERAYQQWSAAMNAQDAHAWAAAITQYRQVVTRNQIVSQGQRFPDAVFQGPLSPPDISRLRLLEAQAVGETAHLLYYGQVDLGGAPEKIPSSVLMVKFFNERGAWRFDSTKLMRIVEQPDIVRQIESGGKLDFLDEPQFTPPGKAPPVPAICPVPDHVTGLTLQTAGYETQMVINGFDYPLMADQAEKMFVTGGLKNGDNEVILTVRPTDIPEGEERLLQLDLFVPSGPGKPATRVYHFQRKNEDLKGTLKLPVRITPQVLKEGV